MSCAIGNAVLDIIEEENLRDNAIAVGTRLLDGLRELKEKHSLKLFIAFKRVCFCFFSWGRKLDFDTISKAVTTYNMVSQGGKSPDWQAFRLVTVI